MGADTFHVIAERLHALGIVEYQYLYQAGRIRWRDGSGAVRATASCRAIMSFASTNGSYRWGLYPGTPTVERPAWAESMRVGVTEAECREVATRAALEAGADFLFEGTWVTLKVYLACNDVVFADDSTQDDSVPWHPVHGDLSRHAALVRALVAAITG